MTLSTPSETLYVTARGLTTSPVPYGARTFQIDFDFVNHELCISATDGRGGRFPLRACSVAVFYRDLMRELGRLGIYPEICRKPNEVNHPTRFDLDTWPSSTLSAANSVVVPLRL
ncbi:DUF5996 family protein [Cupriavidus necator]